MGILNDASGQVAAFMTAAEAAEMERIRADDAVIGIAFFTEDGTALELSGMPEEIIPVFSNVFDIYQRIGLELGESTDRPMVIFDNKTCELFAIGLSSANAVVLRRRGVRFARLGVSAGTRAAAAALRLAARVLCGRVTAQCADERSQSRRLTFRPRTLRGHRRERMLELQHGSAQAVEL